MKQLPRMAKKQYTVQCKPLNVMFLLQNPNFLVQCINNTLVFQWKTVKLYESVRWRRGAKSL